MKLKTTFVLGIICLSFACGSGRQKKKLGYHYPKYWEMYSDQELIDTLYSDTLMIGADINEDHSAVDFYKHQIEKLLIELQRDKNYVSRLYPMGAFDQVTVADGTFRIKKSLNKDQISRLLEIVNDPVSFNWSETTFEPEIQIAFLRGSRIVGVLNIDSDKSIVKTEPELPGYLKMKFGMLKKASRQKLVDLLAEVSF